MTNTAKISVKVTRGKVGCHFSRYNNPGHSRLASRDDRSTPSRVTVDSPWETTFQFDGPGTFIFDIPDWDDDPEVSVSVYINDKVMFTGRGSQENINDWPEKHFGQSSRPTDDREIAIDIN